MQDEQRLKLNPETGYYEGTFTVRVEAEIFRRILFNYVEEQHIDPTDLAAWEKAIGEVARTAKWLTHPRAIVMPEHRQVDDTSTAETEERAIPSSSNFLPQEDEKALWEKARALPVDEWETLLTPLPAELRSNDARKRPFYMRRFAERKSLERLREDLYPVSERVEALAEAMNGNRLK